MQFPEIEWFIDNMFDRMIECGIAEQNATGVAAGLAAEGFVPVTYNFLFASMGRAYNQIRQSILVDRFNVKFLAREGIWGEVGVSHATIEGWGSLRNLPNLVHDQPGRHRRGREGHRGHDAVHRPVRRQDGDEPEPVHHLHRRLPVRHRQGLLAARRQGRHHHRHRLHGHRGHQGRRPAREGRARRGRAQHVHPQAPRRGSHHRGGRAHRRHRDGRELAATSTASATPWPAASARTCPRRW